MSVEISVVLATYKRRDLLERCLRALGRQSLDPQLYEICVADDADLQSTRDQVEALSHEIRAKVRYLRVQGSHGPAAARNVGWRAAQGRIIALTDDDTVPDANWLEAGFRAMSRPKWIAASGCVQMPVPTVPTDYERNESGLCHAEFVTANCFVRKSVLDCIGGFDERFLMAWREDSDLHFTLLKYAQAHGLEMGRALDAVVVHPIRPAKWGISLSQQRKSQFNALLYKKHPQLYRARIQTLPPIRYYVILAFFGIALMSALTGFYRLSLITGWAWLMLTLTFALQRLRGTSLSPSHIAEMVFTSMLIPPLSVYWRIRGALRFQVPFF